MPIPLKVEKQLFEFGDRWRSAFKYDGTDFYNKEAKRLGGEVKGKAESARAVDLIGLHEVSGLWLLEVKDFRGHRSANKRRIQGEVALEVAVKVRDTVAALVGAARKPVTEFPAGKLMKAFERNRPVTVVLWLEDDTFRDEAKAKHQLSVLNNVLKTQLAWLNARTLVLSSAVPNRINDLVVSNLPGAGR